MPIGTVLAASTGRRVRVLMLSQTFAPRIGGLERHMHRLATGLIERGIHVEVLTRRLAGLPRQETLDGIPVWRLAAPDLPIGSRAAFAVRQVWFTCGAIWFLLRHARRFDVLHVMGLSRYAGPIAAVAQTLGLRTVGKVTNLGTGEADCRGTPFAFLHRMLLRRFDTVVALSREIASMLERQGLSPGRIARLPNFVDMAHFQPVGPHERTRLRQRLWPDWPMEACVLLSVGRLDSQKGLGTLLHALSHLAAQSGIRLAIVGEGPERDRLEALASNLGIAGRVRFAGLVRDPQPWYGAADLFVLPSLHEGMPNSLLEAMSSGLPVIATRIAGVTDALGEGSGVLMDSHRPDLWAAAMASLGRSPQLRGTMSRRARARTGERFDGDGIVERYLGLYQRLLAGDARPVGNS